MESRRKGFYGEWEALSKNVGHHGVGRRQKFQNYTGQNVLKQSQKSEIWIRKQIMQNLIFGVYLLISDFLEESLKPKKNWQKDHSFSNTVSLK